MSALFECDGQPQFKPLPLEVSCVLATGREFLGEDGVPFRSSGFKKAVVLPAIDTWREKQLGECPRLARWLAANPEISAQRCFVFEVDGLTVWLPKFELARKLFFHAAFIARAAFVPNGLDMAFTIYNEGDVVHIHTPPKTGAPSRLLKIKGYRDFLSWLLLTQDVKQSFESIWKSLNQAQEQVSQKSAYARWQFDFQAPPSIAGTMMDVRGPFDPESNELLVWEIEALQGLQFSHLGEIFFHHPALKLSVRGESSGCGTVPSGADEVEVDAEEDPTAAKEPSLIHLPVEGIKFDAHMNTMIAYNGEHASGHGKEVDDEQSPGNESKLLGVADPVSDGSTAPGEFQKLGEIEGKDEDKDKEHDRFVGRFSLLREVIEQIAREEPGIVLESLDVKPLPPVPRCSYHMFDDEKPRCYLMAMFKLKNGNQRYLLEIDTSNNRKTMSTRVMGFKADVEVEKCIGRILKKTVKGSLRWPSNMAEFCEPLHSVHHPKESQTGTNPARVNDWKQRIRDVLK